VAQRRIVGIALLRNEEYFSTWSIASAVEFCDEFLVVENQSTDRTLEKVEALRDRFPRITLHQVEDPNRSHRYIEEYAGQDVWVFGVDGDEIYDREGLTRLRPRILDGEFDSWWRMDGHMLHATRLDLERGRGNGYATPATPSVTKLFNFGALESWREPNRERLHGHNMEFRKGWSRDRVLKLYRKESWESADFRALHLCFFPRTSVDRVDPIRRPNPSELRVGRLGRAHNFLKNILANPFSRDASYKTRRYRRGGLVERDISAFGRPGEWRDLDPQADGVEAMLAGSDPAGGSPSTLPG
jgi:glycosyltransferase involved in cell wall biosynthesis